MTMMRKALLAAALLSFAGCAGQDDASILAQDEQQIWMGGKQVKVNPALSHWRDREAQLALHQIFREQPAIASVAPNPANRGQTLTITGSDFNRMLWFGQTYLVSFQAGAARTLAAPASTSNTQITVVVPAGATTGLVRLVNAASGSLWAESALPLTVNVPAPTTGTARFTNDSQFEVYILIVNGTPMIPWGQVLPPGNSFDVTGPGAMVPFHVELGFNLTTFFTFDGSVQIVNGQTVAVSIPRVTAAIALTNGNASGTFEGTYWDNNAAPHVARMVFFPNGTYQLFDDGLFVGLGSYSDGPFRPNSSVIQFTVDGRSTSIDQPYASFLLNNGPPSWPNIQYVRL